MKTKKIIYYILLFLLTIGASLILGFLSFGGMFAILPQLTFCFASLALSVAYEGEIYLQNIKGALNKLFFKHDYLQRHLANEFLEKNFPNITDPDCPKFFAEYAQQLQLLKQLQHKRLNKEDLLLKNRTEKTVRNMEKWFATQLFSSKQSSPSPYEQAVLNWLSPLKQSEQDKGQARQKIFAKVKLFSVIAALFMAVGTTYLLLESFATIPALGAIPFTTLPFFILPMAVVAGAAYGFLTYNALTDMINNDTFNKWYRKIRGDLSQGITFHSLFIASTAVVLLTLTIALTVCTAGTWWTVVKQTPPLFSWMAKMPHFVMGIIHPLVTGLSSLVFNLQNTSESLDMIDEAIKHKDNLLKRVSNAITDSWNHLRENENGLQMINPARILLKITVTPLRIILFLGHLVSIGVTADRVPGMSKILSALLGIISEGFEDMHYFFPHNHNHLKKTPNMKGKDAHALVTEHLGLEHQGHNHDMDIPTRILKTLFWPLYRLAAHWDVWASKQNEELSRKRLDFQQAWAKQYGAHAKAPSDFSHIKGITSEDWKAQHAIYRIERFKEKHLHRVISGKEAACKKMTALSKLQEDLREKAQPNVASILAEAVKQPTYQEQRFFSKGKTKTQMFLEKLQSQCASPAA
jgi:hypothetical protein